MADRLFDRDVVVQIGSTRIASRLQDATRQRLGLRQNEVSTILKVTFKVTKTLKKEPNKAEVAIWNLNSESRATVQQKNQPTIIEAGYIDNRAQIFSGYLDFAESRKDGRSWVTTLQSGDGSVPFKTARINRSFKGPVKVAEALRAAADAMGVNPGNLLEAVSAGPQRGTSDEFANGIVLSGKSEVQLDKLAKTMGLNWSIQNGQLLFLKAGQFIGEQAQLLAPGTGLIGSPEPGENGVVKVLTFIQPNVDPGNRIEVRSASVNGFFRIEKTEYAGDTGGGSGPWYAALECSPL